MSDFDFSALPDRWNPWTSFLALDVETTGLDHTLQDGQPGPDRVVEIAAVLFENGRPTETFLSRVNPERPIPPEVSKLHGVWDADVADAPLFPAAWERVCELATKAPMTLAYNQPFDRPCCRSEVKRANLPAPPLSLRWPWLDPLPFVWKVDRYIKGSGRHRLTAACERRGVQLERAHSADADAVAAGLLWCSMERDVRSLVGGAFSVNALLRVQSALAEERERDFQAWLSRQKQQQGAA